MDKLILNGTDGFPLFTDTLAEAQRAWHVFNAFSAMAGNKAIISGCAQTGNNVSDGFVVINNEVLPFKGGVISSNVCIEETITEREFKDKTRKPVFLQRTVTFGTSTPERTFLWDEFQRISTLQVLQQEKADNSELLLLMHRVEALENKPDPIPIGLVAIWDKPANIPLPAGWVEHEPLRGRTPFGHRNEPHSDFKNLQGEGGSSDMRLLSVHLPPHKHTVEAEFINVNRNDIQPSWEVDTPWYSVSGNFSNRSWINSKKVNTKEAGGEYSDFVGDVVARPFSILPPYRIIKFIRYVGR